MGLRDWMRNRLLDLAMRQMNDLRPEALSDARGEVLEVGFGTGLNLAYYPPHVTSLTALDPNATDGLPAVAERLSAAPFAVEQCRLRADGEDGAFMPRTVNLITGPSRTGDIEQRLQLGAHGPRRLHIIIVDQ